ncbi:unnamed protein product [Owenia fusiformis]|uniref:TBC1 domain family member 20 n=1 Tax=Owenia fusiformis TaxID=6347 RepID=A0A8S4NE00_OWEFU|nr:unnamed protein product [Owenia fusiformis]
MRRNTFQIDYKNCSVRIYRKTEAFCDVSSLGINKNECKDGAGIGGSKSLHSRHKGVHYSTPASDAITRKQKTVAITKALQCDPVDVTSLRQLAISRGGLITDELRYLAWPKLVNVNIYNIPPKPKASVLEAHRDYNQVVLDVNRSLKRFPPGMKDDQRTVLQKQLVDMIMRVLVRHKELHYYQGYHDICVSFLLVMNDDIAFYIMDKLSTNHLRDFMDSSMDRTKCMLNYLYPIIGKANPVLKEFLDRSETGTIFCLPWLITWYGHVLNDFRHTVRLYDFFLACHPLMPIYLAAAIVLYRQDEVLQADCDMPSVHSLLSKIPPDLPFEDLISRAGDLYVQYPPKQLANEARLQYKHSTTISSYMNFEETTQSQRPDTILKQLRSLNISEPSVDGTESESSRLVKVSVYVLATAVSAAAFAVLNTAADWGWF